MKKVCLIFSMLFALMISFTSCEPVEQSSSVDTHIASGDEADDPVDPDEGN